MKPLVVIILTTFTRVLIFMKPIPLFKEWAGREEEEEGVSSYWITKRKGYDNRNLKRKHWIALCGVLALEKAMCLS
jgi:hypothetical protein